MSVLRDYHEHDVAVGRASAGYGGHQQDTEGISRIRRASAGYGGHQQDTEGIGASRRP
jgi:hypothetical protein